jgi:2-haloacid dehalogenase
MGEKVMIDTIVFDLGGVLIDWNPRYVYQNIFKTSEAVEYFLNQICTTDWNELQDAGRSLSDATKILQEIHPHYFTEIQCYYDNWEEMLGGEIGPTVNLLNELYVSKKYKIYALTNWSAETFPIALSKFKCLSLFEGILVSGDEGLKKPDPAIFKLLMDRYDIIANKTLFIDDNAKNIVAAQNLGFNVVHFISIVTGIDKIKESLNR